MPSTRDIRRRIKSVKNTAQITKAMQMVASAKMRRAQQAALAGRPYATLMNEVLAAATAGAGEFTHPLMEKRPVKKRALILITSDKGLCGALNTNLLRLVLSEYRAWQAQGEEIDVCALGAKGLGFMQRLGAKVVSQVTQMGDRPQMEKLIGAIKVMLDGYIQDRFDRVLIFYTRFINTMKQEPVVQKLLPLSSDEMREETVKSGSHGWDYIYEPDAQTVIDELLVRYVEALVYQAVAENMAFYADLFGVVGAEREQLSARLLRMTRMEPFQQRRAGKLSGGMKQKLALMCTLLHKPRVLFLDEPTAGIDPVARRELWDLLFEFSSQGMTLFVTTHYMDEAARCERLAFLSRGHLIGVGTPDEVTRQFGEETIEDVFIQLQRKDEGAVA